MGCIILNLLSILKIYHKIQRTMYVKKKKNYLNVHDSNANLLISTFFFKFNQNLLISRSFSPAKHISFFSILHQFFFFSFAISFMTPQILFWISFWIYTFFVISFSFCRTPDSILTLIKTTTYSTDVCDYQEKIICCIFEFY